MSYYDKDEDIADYYLAQAGEMTDAEVLAELTDDERRPLEDSDGVNAYWYHEMCRCLAAERIARRELKAERDAVHAQRDEIHTATWELCREFRETLDHRVNHDHYEQWVIDKSVALLTAAEDAISRTPAQSLARWQAMARVCEAAPMLLDLLCFEGASMSYYEPSDAHTAAWKEAKAALAALDQLDRDGGYVTDNPLLRLCTKCHKPHGRCEC